MVKERNQNWLSYQAAYLKRNYGRVPIAEICSTLGVTKRAVYSKAKYLKVTRRSKCEICGKRLLGKLRKESYCSVGCRRIANTARHRVYVANNRAHIREYSRARKLRIWGVSNMEIAIKAERFAIERILPSLGFSDFFHASAVRRYVPFDIVATYKGRRVLKDVTTSLTKSIGSKQQHLFASALRMPIYALFVKPDLSKYQLRLSVGSKSLVMHISELLAVE
jgi:hypothetical protein